MSYEEKVRWLRRYRDALRLEEELRQELEAQRARACKTTAALTGMPGGGDSLNDKIPKSVEHILDIQESLQEQINACNDVYEEVRSAIECIPDVRIREIYRCRYLLCWTWERIAESMKVSAKWVKRLHDRHLCPWDFM